RNAGLGRRAPRPSDPGNAGAPSSLSAGAPGDRFRGRAWRIRGSAAGGRGHNPVSTRSALRREAPDPARRPGCSPLVAEGAAVAERLPTARIVGQGGVEMRLNHPYDLRDMLDAAGAARSGSGGSGRTELVGQFASLKARLPRFVQRRLPSDVPSTLLFVAYAWTAVFALSSIVHAIGDPDQVPLIFLAAFYLVAGLAGLWYGTNLVVLIPSAVLWLLIALANLFLSQPSYLATLVFGACTAVGVWVGVRSVIGEGLDVVRSNQIAKAATNQLAWDLYRLSEQAPVTNEALSGIGVYKELRIGELQRHFDQTIAAAIQGGMQHVFNLSGSSAAVHHLPMPFLGDTQSFMRLGGSGTSSLQLGMTGTTADELTGEAFVAVFERILTDGLDTVRAVVPSERQARAYVIQLFTFWSRQLGANTESELMLRRYAGAISQAVASDSGYVGDRLNAILRLPATERPTVTVIGEQLDRHAILVGAVRFGPTGPLYQLFPIALVRALV